MNKLKKLVRHQRGDTIIEVMISMTILALVLAVTFVSTSHSLRQGTSANNRQTATSYAQQQIELIKNIPTLSTNPDYTTITSGKDFVVCSSDNKPQLVTSTNTNPCGGSAFGQYAVSDKYSSGLFTISANWPGPDVNQDNLAVYYRSSDGSNFSSSCPSGDSGTPPNCVKQTCPSGTFGTPGNCQPVNSLQPLVVTVGADNLGQTTATLHGTIVANGSTATCRFEWGTSTSYGQSLGCTADPGSGNNLVTESLPISSLTAGTTYHFRIDGTNAAGTANGADLTFNTKAPTPPPPPTITTFTWSPGPGYYTPGADRETGYNFIENDDWYLYWNVDGAASCRMTGTSVAFNGAAGQNVPTSIPFDPPNGEYGVSADRFHASNGFSPTYTLTCANPTGQQSTISCTPYFGALDNSNQSATNPSPYPGCGPTVSGNDPIINFFNWLGGNSFGYQARNTSWCEIFVDNPSGGSWFVPAGDDAAGGTSATAGTAPTGGQMECGNDADPGLNTWSGFSGP